MTAVRTAAEHRWISAVVARGCIVCRNLGHGPTPAVYHHIREHTGAGRRAGNALGLALCSAHHNEGGHGVAYHAGPRTWERIYGDQLDLLNQTILEIAGEM